MSAFVEEGVQPKLDAEFGKLAFVPVHEVKDLGAARLHSSKAELAADDGQSLNDFNAVTAFGGGAGGLQPCGAGADD